MNLFVGIVVTNSRLIGFNRIQKGRRKIIPSSDTIDAVHNTGCFHTSSFSKIIPVYFSFFHDEPDILQYGNFI